MAVAGYGFNWGLNGRDLIDGLDNLLNQPNLMCYSGRTGRIGNADLSYQLGGPQDQINFEDENAYGVLDPYPCTQIYLQTECKQITADPLELTVRIDYDIVTLTQSEQADLYRTLGCCG